MNGKFILNLLICAAGILISPVCFAQSFSDLTTTEVSPDAASYGPSQGYDQATQQNILPKDQAQMDPKTKAAQYPADLEPLTGVDRNMRHEVPSNEPIGVAPVRSVTDKNSTYTLGPTDVIEITVLRHPEVSGKYILNTEGKIQYEFIGDVVLSGKTKEDAVEVLAKALSTYIVNPQVTVKISEYNSKIVYVVGEVARPGRIIMRGDTITIREALLEAGLPLLTANTTHSTMFTPTAGKVKQRIVDVHALLFKGDLRQNYIMKPGDTLYVPATFWAKATRVISPVTQPIGQAASTGATITTGIP